MDTYFSESDGLKFHFQERYAGRAHVERMVGEKSTPDDFPVYLKKQNLIGEYQALEQRLNKEYHSKTNLRVAIKEDGLLTDHSGGHIDMVIYYAYKIIEKNIQFLTGYEIYFLLLAIHFHDLGLIYGRKGHEKSVEKVINNMGDTLFLEITEKRFVIAIAQAHGGDYNGDKDTIRYIADEVCSGLRVRAKLLAALLRFADEIADNYTRSEDDVPEKNEIFHVYSKCLDLVSITEGTVMTFQYNIPFKYTQQELGKYDEKIFLYDEILIRLAKCMRELEYCRKYADDFISITTLDVFVYILEKDNDLKIIDKSFFQLKLQGYPDENQTNIEHYLDNKRININSSLRYKTGAELCEKMKESR